MKGDVRNMKTYSIQYDRNDCVLYRMPEKREKSSMKTTSLPESTTSEEMVSDEAPSIPTTPGSTSCAANPGLFDYVAEAFTFGEEDTSFNQINVTKKEVLRRCVSVCSLH